MTPCMGFMKNILGLFVMNLKDAFSVELVFLIWREATESMARSGFSKIRRS